MLIYDTTVMAYEILKNHSEASRGVLQSGYTVYNCISTAVVHVVLYVQYAYMLWHCARLCTFSSDVSDFHWPRLYSYWVTY